MEKKSLFINFSGIGYSFTAEPVERKAEEPIRFTVDMGDNNPSELQYRFDAWEQVSGRQIYTDIMIAMGHTIQKNFPELFE